VTLSQTKKQPCFSEHDKVEPPQAVTKRLLLQGLENQKSNSIQMLLNIKLFCPDIVGLGASGGAGYPGILAFSRNIISLGIICVGI
jgi:hypothetical protein